MIKILYSGYYDTGCHPFDAMAEKVEVAALPEDLVELDSALVIWGGSDIGPGYYKHPQSKTTYPHPTRDRAEWALIERAVNLGIPIIGVCRGAQMLCAYAGGSLIQDVRGHAGRGHTVTTNTGEVFSVNSIHHQMLCLDEVDHELLAWTTNNISPTYIWKDDQVYVPKAEFKEPELVDFPHIKGFAIQWHPEAMPANCSATRFIYEEFTKRYIKEAV